jgi:hypothetical protein
MELFITGLVVGAVCYFVWWIGSKLAAPAKEIVQVIAIGSGVLWLLFNIREIVHTLVSGRI